MSALRNIDTMVDPKAATTGNSADGFAPRARAAASVLPSGQHLALWRGSDLDTSGTPVLRSGFAALDAELPGGGWPSHAVIELLASHTAALEWRLLWPALAPALATGGTVVLVGPPHMPHAPGLGQAGIAAQQLVWIQADSPAERLWCTEQLVRANACAAVLAWLPQARPEQIRRLQVCAQACAEPVFIFRPERARHESSAAPLRVLLTLGARWELEVQVLKRRGPAHDGRVRLHAPPASLNAVLPARLHRPSLAAAHSLPPVSSHALGRIALAPAPQRHTAHA